MPLARNTVPEVTRSTVHMNDALKDMDSEPEDRLGAATVEAEIARVRRLAAYARPSARYCEDCDDEIPEARRAVVPGCQRCVECEEVYARTRPAARGMRIDAA